MTLGTLVLIITVVAIALTAAIAVFDKIPKSWLLTFLQNFCGALFIFSGAVKAIDPLGTAYKMEQYFAEFERAFTGTWFSFLVPLFPKFAAAAPTFSTTMIVLEIVIGAMLLLGVRNKFTSWVFLLIVAFFTFLTGFTYLTGYVPDGVNFFQFGKWGPYVETNMKVTDCGCFGDFMTLHPRVSFLKDVVLMIPALLFVFRHKNMHQLLSPVGRTVITSLVTAGSIFFCLSNYVWDLPVVDFRPFKVGVNIAERKQAEAEAASQVTILAYKLTNKNNKKQVVELPYEQFLKEFSNYPSEEWEYEQIKSKPTVARTKISDFDLQNEEGESVANMILSDPNYSFLVVAYKLYGKETGKETISVTDTIFMLDTIGGEVTPRVTDIVKREVERTAFTWDAAYLQRWTEVINPVVDAATQDGYRVHAVTAFEDPEKIARFREVSQSHYPFFTADDILLKTIIRSNPGVTLLKNGTVIQHWHFRQLPDYATIKSKYLK